MNNNELCKCGSKVSFGNCCAKYIIDGLLPDNPETLMRSRYSAFAINDMAYIGRTMSGNAAIDFDEEVAKLDNQRIKWLKLEVIRCETENNAGLVEFKAYYRTNGKKYCLHEVSKFMKINNLWFYTDQC